MTTTKLLLSGIILITSLFAHSQDTTLIKAELTSATVYFGYGAELTHQSKGMVNSKTRNIIISGLATTIDPNSIQVNIPESVALLSQKFRVFTPETRVSDNPLIKVYADSMAGIQKQIARINNQSEIERVTMEKTGQLIEMIISHNDNKTTTSEEALKLINAYTQKIEKAKTRIFTLSNEKTTCESRYYELQNKIAELHNQIPQGNKPTGQIILQVKCNMNEEIPIALSYFTNNAGFTPLYDVRVNSKTNETRLIYKAGIFQNTGLDWNQTKLTLSTANPNWNGTTPILNAWYLQIFEPKIYYMKAEAMANAPAANVITSLEKAEAKEVIVEDANGYQNQVRNNWQNTDPSTLQSYTTLNENQLNTTFIIDLPYDIKSDGEIQSVTIKEEKIVATFKNYAVPKLNRDAFLLAEISDWETLNLMPGIANIIMDDTYLGKTTIDPNISADTMNLSLGKDKRVAVNRTRVKEFTTTKRSGNTTIQTFTYEITVKNNKSTDVNIILKDQHPISQIKEVEVKLENSDNAKVNGELGVLTWEIALKPGESKKVRFSYTVKYPSEKRIVNL